MSVAMIPEQTALWVDRCQQNIQRFRQERAQMTAADQIRFVRTQYAVLRALCKVARGDAHLQGTSFPSRTAPSE